MKKLYTTLLAACTLFAASAAAPQISDATLTAVSNNVVKPATKINASRLKTVDLNLGEVSAPRRMGAANPMAEEYTWESKGAGKYAASILAEMYGNSTDPVDVEIFEAKEKPGLYKAVGVWPDMVENGELIVDASDPEFVTVAKQFTGVIDEEDGETYIASQSWIFNQEYDKDLIISKVPGIVPTLVDGCIYFPAEALVLNWPNAPEDSKYGTDPTAWAAGDASGYLLLPGGEYVEPWTSLGKGTFSGDVYYTVLLNEQSYSDYEVEVYQSTDNENIYRVKNPIRPIYEAAGIDGESPEWKIDTTDPNEITISLTSLGVGNQTDGLYYAGTTNLGYKVCPEEYKSKFTKENNCLTFTFPVDGLLLYTAITKKAFPVNETEVTLTVKLKDDGSGLGSIEAVDNNAPVEYFNLQGQRVSNPAAGQLMIKRQGTKVSKVVVR